MSKKNIPHSNLKDDVSFDIINMRLDDIAYTFNPKTGNWMMHPLSSIKGNNVLPNVSPFSSKNGPMVENLDLEIRAKLAQNKELEEMRNRISETRVRLDIINKKLSESQENQKLLTENYIRETIEVEKIKEAREKLEKLKKELGAA